MDGLTARFQNELDKIVKHAAWPGATAAVLSAQGDVTCFASGLADLEGQLPMGPTSRMPAGSVGKTFVSAVALALDREGKLNLDDKISKWLGSESWFGRLPNGDGITLRMLLNHSTGLVDHTATAQFANDLRVGLTVTETAESLYFSPTKLISYVLDLKPLFPPGEGHAYGDTNYILAAIIIEMASGKTYFKELAWRFLDPLKLDMTSAMNTRVHAGLVPGYIEPDNEIGLPTKTASNGVMAFNPATEWSGGGLVSTPADLVRWARSLLTGEALSEPYLDDLLEASQVEVDNKQSYGLGIRIRQSETGLIYGHNGVFPGYRTTLAYYPDYDVAIACQVNTSAHDDCDMEIMLQALAKTILPSIEDCN